MVRLDSLDLDLLSLGGRASLGRLRSRSRPPPDLLGGERLGLLLGLSRLLLCGGGLLLRLGLRLLPYRPPRRGGGVRDKDLERDRGPGDILLLLGGGLLLILSRPLLSRGEKLGDRRRLREGGGEPDGDLLLARGGGERDRRRGGDADGERFPDGPPGERERFRRGGVREGEREERVLNPGDGERRRGGGLRSGLRPPRGR